MGPRGTCRNRHTIHLRLIHHPAKFLQLLLLHPHRSSNRLARGGMIPTPRMSQLSLTLPCSSLQTSLHQSFAIPYVAIAAGLYGADRVIRILKSRITTAYLQPVPGLGSTLVRIPRLNKGWTAGQHVRIRVLSTSTWRDVFGWAETHPYTIASPCEDLKDGEGLLGEGMILLVKKTGGWSDRLYCMAMEGTGEKNAGNDGEPATFNATGTGRNVRVLVDGPYGERCFCGKFISRTP